MVIRAGIFSTFFLISGCSDLSTLSAISQVGNTLAVVNLANNFDEDSCNDVSGINSRELLPYLKANNYPLIVAGDKKFVCTCAGNNLSLHSERDEAIAEDRWGELVGKRERVYLEGRGENYRIYGMSENELLVGNAETSDLIGLDEKPALLSGAYEIEEIIGLDESSSVVGVGETSILEGKSEIFKHENAAYSCRAVSNCAGFQLTGFGVDYVTLVTENGSKLSSTSCVTI